MKSYFYKGVNKMMETVEITETEYNNLLFRQQQIEQICELANQLEEGMIDGFDFGEMVLDIL